MKLILFAIFSLSFFNQTFAQTSYSTEAIYEPIIYPNPANEQINIFFETPIKGQISLLDLSGKAVLVEQFTGTNHALDLSGFNAGIYMLAIQTDLFSMQKKIVVVK